MDYCSTCRRHLNGALVCPGCGAYAPDIAPGVVGGHTVPGTATSAAGPTPPVAPPASHPGDVPRETPAASQTPAPSGTGRAARRRQLARWKKTQRRALVATAVALVGGGLTLASMDRGTGDRAQAAAAPGHEGMGGATGPAGSSTVPGSPDASPDRTRQSPPADDGDRTPAGAAPASTAPSRPHTDSPSGPDTEVTSRPRTTTPDSVSRSGARSDAGGSADTDTGTGTDTGPGSASGSGTATRPTPPPPAPGGGDATGGTDQGDGSVPAPSTPPSTEPDSSRLCLLVICLG
ncbi:hypothetical protein ACFVZC_22340 [Streptomyces marokkonensis]|uniref:Uncharacterized protein n=1 Tax=Streptomyces marokkonensis TaxID=324855 RepID=A0ABW6QA62_9ACTN